jgi:hypothetical protein
MRIKIRTRNPLEVTGNKLLFKNTIKFQNGIARHEHSFKLTVSRSCVKTQFCPSKYFNEVRGKKNKKMLSYDHISRDSKWKHDRLRLSLKKQFINECG